MSSATTPAKHEHLRGALVGSSGGLKEGLFGLGCGVLYGLTSPIIGHPLDTIKTKMQAQPEYMQGGMFQTIKKVMRNEGFMGLYRGLIPPLLGSSVFRSVQFGAYGYAYGLMKNNRFLCEEIPFTSGLQARVLIAGMFSAFLRSVIECPLELMKVRRQTGQNWRVGGSSLLTAVGWREIASFKQLREIYKGYGITFFRTWMLMGSFFVLVDYSGGICATISWLMVWPLEFVKSQVQANTALVGNNAHQSLSTVQRLRFAIREQGFFSLYRGILPGCTRSLVANGMSMVVYTYCQALRHHLFEEQQHPHQKQ